MYVKCWSLIFHQIQYSEWVLGPSTRFILSLTKCSGQVVGLIMDYELWIDFPPEAGRLISDIWYLISDFWFLPITSL